MIDQDEVMSFDEKQRNKTGRRKYYGRDSF